MAYPSLPASPTLTNPDMILPYGEYDSTPSPPRHPYRSEDDEWRSSRPQDMQFSIGLPHAPLGPITPTTPIIYGNGTMLSDIGEVTEAESTPGRKLPGPAERRMLKQQAQSASLRSSPTLGPNTITPKRSRVGMHERRMSAESVSTITSEGRAEQFKDFDDGVSVDDSVFQGDDEESVADSYTEDIIAAETQRLSKRTSSIEQDEDRNSSAALSRRAEQILLNAKKRLNNMEGNLTRARSSLHITPSSSMPSIHSSSPLSRLTPSPPDAKERMMSQLGIPPSKHRQLNTPAESPDGSPGHTRVSSENLVSPGLRTGPFPARSLSAAARYIGKGGFESSPISPPLSNSPDFARERPLPSPLTRTSPPRGPQLQSLNEDHVTPEFESDQYGMDDTRSSASEHRGLTRSTSSMQMRDLRDQMHDLKGRLSVLRDRARDDNMKRRSLQSLRTPSPFTAAEQWYLSSKNYGEGELSADAGMANPYEPTDNTADEKLDDVKPSSRTQHNEYAASDVTSVYEDVSEGRRSSEELQRDELSILKDEEYFNTIGEESQDSIEDDIDDDYNEEMIDPEELDEYESDASLYHDSLTAPLSHEDREDAFDYEHFFLHSAMGTISQQRNGRRGSAGSYSSEGSVETTKGPTVPTELNERPFTSHLRSESTDSISTMATFATATEGLGSENGDEEERDDYFVGDDYAVQHVIAAPLRTTTPVTEKRSTFGSPKKNGLPNDRQPTPDETSRPGSVIHVPVGRTSITVNRPSVASFDSFESTGTTRSFPLVSKPKSQKSLTPDVRASQLSCSILSESATLIDSQGVERISSSPVHMLAKDDQVLVEKLVASLGKCVLGLQEAAKGSPESKVLRRRLDVARRTLEGEEGPI